MSVLLPPGPFPPRSLNEGSDIDLAVRLWRSFFQREWLADEGRGMLEQRLALAVDAADWARADRLLTAFVDSWPLAAGIADAGEAWRGEALPSALEIIARAAELVRLALDWSTLPDGCWVMPDEPWIRSQIEQRSPELQARGHGDGAVEIADLLDCGCTGAPEPPIGIELVSADHLVSERARLGGALARGELRGVLVQGVVGDEPLVQLALGELRLEGSHQRLLERFGAAAAAVPSAGAGDLLRWGDDGLLDAAPAATGGPVLSACCQGRFMPGPPSAVRAGRPQRVGYLLWDAPVAPLMVAPVAVAVLSALDGRRDAAAVAELLGGPEDQVRSIMDELVALGAASSVG